MISRSRRAASASASVLLTFAFWFISGSAPAAEPVQFSEAAGTLAIEDQHAVLDADVYIGERVRHEYRVTNPSSRTVTVVSTRNPQGGGEVVVVPQTIAAGATARLIVDQEANRLGSFNFRFSFVTDEAGAPRYYVSLSGFAQSAFDPEVLAFTFGMVDRENPHKVRLELGSREVARLEILESRGLPPFLALRTSRSGVVDESVSLELIPAPEAPLGFHAGAFEILTNVPHQPRLIATYSLHVYGELVPDRSPVEIGSFTPGEDLVGSFLLQSRSGAGFEISRAVSTVPTASVETRRCADDAGCWVLELRAHPAVEERQVVSGEVIVFVSGSPEPIPVRFQGTYFPAGTRIRQLEIPEAAPGPGTP